MSVMQLAKSGRPLSTFRVLLSARSHTDPEIPIAPADYLGNGRKDVNHS